MGIHKGTKLKDNPKKDFFKLRLDEQTMDKLNKLSEIKNVSKSEIIRNGVEIQYKNVK